MTSLLLITAFVLGGNAHEARTQDDDSLQQPAMVYATESVETSLFDQKVGDLRFNDSGNRGIVRLVGDGGDHNLASPPIPAVRPVMKVSNISRQIESPSDAPGVPVAPPAPIAIHSQEQTPHYFSADSSDCGCAPVCNTGCHSDCGPCGHGGLVGGCGLGLHQGGYWAKHCLPSPWHAPGNMAPRFPYEAYPHTYYYFRPYNMLHIPEQQEIARGWVDDPGLPYSNSVFAKVYAEYEAELINRPAPIRPMSYHQPRR